MSPPKGNVNASYSYVMYNKIGLFYERDEVLRSPSCITMHIFPVVVVRRGSTSIHND